METFEEALNKIKASINSLITSETKDEDIEMLKNLNNDIDNINSKHKEVVNAYASMKDKYIESITRMGTTKVVSETGVSTPRSFEQIVNDTISQRK